MTPHTVWYLSITIYVYIIYLVQFVLNCFDLVVILLIDFQVSFLKMEFVTEKFSS